MSDESRAIDSQEPGVWSSVGAYVLSFMRRTWTNHGLPGEPYREKEAVEIAVNELLAHARERGWEPTHAGREIGHKGIVIKE